MTTATSSCSRDGRGYHGSRVDEVEVGARYRYRLDGGPELADPCSRFQPDGVHGPSALVDLSRFVWHDAGFVPPPLERFVVYELHVGTFTAEGTLDAAIEDLDHLVELGVNAVELMPVAQFPGRRNWGYDGVFAFAVQDSYGGPAALQRFVDGAHSRRLAVVADVVYNHFGPEGNVLESYGPYVTDRYSTPWGPGVNVAEADSDEVRRFFIENALCYFADFHVDALRLDAVHGIVDRSPSPFLAELAEATAALAATTGRPLRLIAESADNDPRVITGPEIGGYGLDAQWCDDFHHSLHVLLTGERGGYYADYGDPEQLARAIANGYCFEGEYSVFRRRRHGVPPKALGRHRFVAFTQNHDQIGNRRGGERLAALVDAPRLRLAASAPPAVAVRPVVVHGRGIRRHRAIPVLRRPLGRGPPQAVREGRAAEFGLGEILSDPASPSTFVAARPDRALRKQPGHADLYSLGAARRPCAPVRWSPMPRRRPRSIQRVTSSCWARSSSDARLRSSTLPQRLHRRFFPAPALMQARGGASWTAVPASSAEPGRSSLRRSSQVSP